MALTLLRHADVLVTMDAARREIPDGAVLIRDGLIEAVGTTQDVVVPAGETALILDLRGRVLLPGLVNTHHHMFQCLTRALPRAQDAERFGWLNELYPLWAGLTPEMLRVSSLVAMAELLLLGTTTSSDHLYLFANGCRLEDSIEAAAQIGLRFHAARGSMSVGRSGGGVPPDALVEQPEAILRDTRRLIERWHDPAHGALLRIVVAPCSPFSVSQDLMRESAALARAYGVGMRTHLAESDLDVAYSRERFGMTPSEYAQRVDWTASDVWHAHCVKLDAEGIGLFAATGTGVAHCPWSNMRLASGIAPVAAMHAAGVTVGLGVDGSASNDGAHLLGEARQALLLARVDGNAASLTARRVLEMATLGGARVLGRDDIGAIAPGLCADLAAFRMDGLAHAGASVHDPVASLLFSAPAGAELCIVAGRVLVSDGQFQVLELPPPVGQHTRLARQLVQRH